ncbi:DUF6498-containing protein [Natrarchaeobius halalkaliphilus]|uniref:DUF6498-containing protein n=1 Tax=Natrarchaeobius halalkaliphilus TaxID=1679091 RepID=UPI0024364775|nr:DUF6498-containing protein [Natrarchaeobius halalkaliphilus]
MVPSRIRARAPSTAAFAPILFANLVPLVGVLAYGWEPSTLVVIYALEVLLAFPLAATKALFAGRPPRVEDLEKDSGNLGVLSVGNTDLVRKRGSITLVSWLPPVYPRNLPFVGAVIFGACGPRSSSWPPWRRSPSTRRSRGRKSGSASQR